MSKRIRVKEKTLPTVKDAATPMRRVPPETVAEALGATLVGSGARRGASPPARWARVLRQVLLQRLVSTGGRPRLAETTRRQKIPLGDQDWKKLVGLARRIQGEGFHPTPGQLASALLHQLLETMDPERDSEAIQGLLEGLAPEAAARVRDDDESCS